MTRLDRVIHPVVVPTNTVGACGPISWMGRPIKWGDDGFGGRCQSSKSSVIPDQARSAADPGSRAAWSSPSRLIAIPARPRISSGLAGMTNRWG